MWDYVATELPEVVSDAFALDPDRQAITGHSMGGHGALTLAMAHPGRYRSVSAFAPTAHPTASDWGRMQLGAYLGADEAEWAAHDATLQMQELGLDVPLLVDQAGRTSSLDLLMPEALSHAMAARRQGWRLPDQRGYDHSYFFVASFILITCLSTPMRCLAERGLR